ncbi:hypothetical protein ONZ43_g3270 [Nemania bipapillata]|uniref:Uncharacterized protein n=1 Tax=Nemania bipapillata TaxID=110536 RepID=A0ACC2IXI9_9PEZI|nr:hypothetical protein ONZ43_g3270 [Nemania bipapillata]
MKFLAIIPAFLATFAVADQVWPLEQYDNPLPTFVTSEDITLTWEKGYFNPYVGHDYTPATFTLSLAAYNNTPTGYYTDLFGNKQPIYEVSTVVELDDDAPTNALSYKVKPELINGWEGDAYWYFFITSWVGTNGVAEEFGTRNFYLTN